MLDLACSRGLVQGATALRNYADEATDLAKLIRGASTRLEGLERSPVVQSRLAIVKHPEFGVLSDKMKSYAKCLEEDAKALGNRHYTVRTTPRFGVAWLVSQVEASTGEAYPEQVAKVMNAYFVMRNLRKRVTEESIDKQVRRFQKEDPLMYRLLQAMVHIGAKASPRSIAAKL